MNFNLPNSLTLLRIILIPLIVILFVSNDESNRFLAFLLFLIASVTDYLDGLLARYMKQQTNFGEFLDPVADKLLVIITMILLISENQEILFMIPVLVIVTREFLVIAIRQRLAEVGENIKLSVILISKIKTAIQLISLLLLFLHLLEVIIIQILIY